MIDTLSRVRYLHFGYRRSYEVLSKGSFRRHGDFVAPRPTLKASQLLFQSSLPSFVTFYTTYKATSESQGRLFACFNLMQGISPYFSDIELDLIRSRYFPSEFPRLVVSEHSARFRSIDFNDSSSWVATYS